jgi:phage terminase large subunit
MTTTIAEEIRRRGRSKGRPVTAASDLSAAIRDMLSTRVRWPSAKYRSDPVAFFREILGVEPWSKQVEIIEAIRDNPRVAIASGHKVSKSHTAAGAALWFYSSFPDARVVMSSTTARQVDQILWRELKMMRSRGGRCTECKAADPDGRRIPRPCGHSALIDGEIGELARTGLKSPDFREIVGFTAREAEAVAGVSGRNLLYLIDEASGVPEAIFEAIEGNRAGGARIVLFSNPTRTSGEFFDAFHSKARFYKTVRVSSEETPNVVSGRVLVPGLATREWIDEKREEWGEESPLYKVRVKGEFALNEDGKIFSIHAIATAEQRWAETPDTGRLFVGLDPAGATGSGDESVFVVRRGMKMLAIHAQRGLTHEGHLVQLLGLIARHTHPRELPVVVFDREGPIGYELSKLFAAHTAERQAFESIAVRSSDRSLRLPMVYDRMRDALAANLEAWFRDGGAIVEDVKLAAELHALEWKQQTNGRLKLTPKEDIRKELGRSPDRYDALALACWEPLSLQTADSVPDSAKRFAGVHESHDDVVASLDPYAGSAAWGRG